MGMIDPEMAITEPTTFRSLMQHASTLTGVPMHDLYGPKRHRYICAVRAAVYRVARDELKMSYPRIGDRAGRDHATVMNGLSKIDTYIRFYPDITRLIKALRDGSDDGRPYTVMPIRQFTGSIWTGREALLLSQMRCQGMRWVDIAREMGRSVDACRNYVRRHGLKQLDIPCRASNDEIDQILEPDSYRAVEQFA